MTQLLKRAVPVLMAAAFAIALATPSQAQQGYGAYDYVPGPAAPATGCSQSPSSGNFVPCPDHD